MCFTLYNSFIKRCLLTSTPLSRKVFQTHYQSRYTERQTQDDQDSHEQGWFLLYCFISSQLFKPSAVFVCSVRWYMMPCLRSEVGRSHTSVLAAFSTLTVMDGTAGLKFAYLSSLGQRQSLEKQHHRSSIFIFCLSWPVSSPYLSM